MSVINYDSHIFFLIIGSVEYSTLVDREKLPFTRIQDDNSRLIDFYNTDAGKWYMAKENITNMLIGNSTQLLRTDMFFSI